MQGGPGFDPQAGNEISHAATNSWHAAMKIKDPMWHKKDSAAK